MKRFDKDIKMIIKRKKDFLENLENKKSDKPWKRSSIKDITEVERSFYKSFR